jgi:HlyD family secretion protein
VRKWKNTRVLVAVAVVAAFAAVAMWPARLGVDVALVTRGPMQVTVDEEGETRVRERFVVSAPVAGRLRRIELEPGDPVVCGKTVVVRLLPVDAPLLDARTRRELAAAVEAARAAVGQARADRDRATAASERARSSLGRLQTLAAAGAISREELEAAQTAAKTAEGAARAADFAVDRMEHEFQLAQARLQAPPAAGRVIEIRAPADGVVLRRLRQSEAVVAAGEPLLEIGDPGQLEVVADLLSTDAVRVRPGSAVQVEPGGPGTSLRGLVRRVEPSGFMKVSALGVEEQRVNVIIDFADAAASARALGDGYRVELRIVTSDDADAIKVPVGSLFRRGAEWAVFVVDGGRARMQIVELSERNNEEAEIVRGLEPGQTVILHPPDTLTHGARVEPRR